MGSTELIDVRINFHIGRRRRTERLDALFEVLGTENGEGKQNFLAEIDGCLSSAKFSRLKPGKLVIGITITRGFDDDDKLGVTDEQWETLVRGKMLCADKRGILRSVLSR